MSPVPDAVETLARYVALLAYQDGGIETMIEAAGRSLCEVAGEKGAEEALEYVLIGAARALAAFDDPELKKALMSGSGEAELLAEMVAAKAKELIASQSPSFYRATLEYIRKRCRI